MIISRTMPVCDDSFFFFQSAISDECFTLRFVDVDEVEVVAAVRGISLRQITPSAVCGTVLHDLIYHYKTINFYGTGMQFEKILSFCGLTYTLGINEKLLLYNIISFMVQMGYIYENGHCAKSIVTYPQQMLTFYRFTDNFFLYGT